MRHITILNKASKKANLSISQKINSSFIKKNVFCFNHRLLFGSAYSSSTELEEILQALDIKFHFSPKGMVFRNWATKSLVF